MTVPPSEVVKVGDRVTMTHYWRWLDGAWDESMRNEDYANNIDGFLAEYVLVPYADFNLIKFPNREKAMEKIQDLTLLSDIFPTGYHGAVTAGVTTGSVVYVAGAGPVGLACAASCHLLGAAVVIVGDMIPERLAQAKSFGCEVVDLRQKASLGEQIAQIVGVPEVDAAVGSLIGRPGDRRGAIVLRDGYDIADDGRCHIRHGESERRCRRCRPPPGPGPGA